jgi:hypothetical protein
MSRIMREKCLARAVCPLFTGSKILGPKSEPMGRCGLDPKIIVTADSDCISPTNFAREQAEKAIARSSSMVRA